MGHEGDADQPGKPDDLRKEVLGQVRYLRIRLGETIDTVENAVAGTGDVPPAAEFKKRLSELRQMLGLAIAEEAKLEAECRVASGGAQAGAFDLEAARAEIGSRLARLRAARGDGGVSGEPE